MQPTVRKVCAALLAGWSTCVVWASATIFTGGHPDLSPFSLMIRSANRLGPAKGLLVVLLNSFVCVLTGFSQPA